MPAPNAKQLEGLATGALQSAGLKGESIPDLAKALASSMANTLSMFLGSAKVMPGVPGVVAPNGSGATNGPGTLMPPPAGGPTAQQLEAMILGELQGAGIKGENAPDLAAAVASSYAQAVQLFTTQVKVAPGIAVAGFATSAPGMLM